MRPLRASWLVSFAVAVASFGAGFVVFSPKGKPRADGAAPAGTLRGMLAGRFSAASEDRVVALFAAFDEREPLRRDAAIFRAIEALQPGDALGALGDLTALIRRVEKLPRTGIVANTSLAEAPSRPGKEGRKTRWLASDTALSIA